MKINDEVSSLFIETPETLVLTRHIDIFSNKDLLVTVNLFTNSQNQIGCLTKAKQFTVFVWLDFNLIK